MHEDAQHHARANRRRQDDARLGMGDVIGLAAVTGLIGAVGLAAFLAATLAIAF